jgi:hypothetical protein
MVTQSITQSAQPTVSDQPAGIVMDTRSRATPAAASDGRAQPRRQQHQDNGERRLHPQPATANGAAVCTVLAVVALQGFDFSVPVV